MPPLPQELIDEFVANAHGNPARVRELLEAHPDLLMANASWNEVAIAAAAQTAQVETVEYLLSKGAPLDICAAATLGRIEAVEGFLAADAGAARARGAHGLSVLYHAVVGGQVAVAELLLAHGAPLDAGSTPALHGAVTANRLEMIEWLLERGADVNVPNREGQTPLKAALGRGNEAAAALLRRRGGRE